MCVSLHAALHIKRTSSVRYVHTTCCFLTNTQSPVEMSIIVQQDATYYSFYYLQTALHVSGDTFAHHQEHE
jgi:hypothetical protein